MQPPVVVVLGDSVAETLGAALQTTAPPGTTVLPHATFGCGLATGTWASDNPPVPGLPMFSACNDGTPMSQQWPSLAAQAVLGTAPGDIVLFIAGDWECQDILHDGQWSNITQPAFQRYLLDQMDLAIAVTTAHGAHLDFTTMPAMNNGTLGDSPVRRHIYDGLLAQVASAFPGRVSVVDLGDVLSPGGNYREFLDGVQVRTADGIHTPAYAPGNPFIGNSSQAVADAFNKWLAPRLWPLIIDTDHTVGAT